MEQTPAETKTYFGDKNSETGITPLLWSQGDVLSVFMGTSTTNIPFSLIDGKGTSKGVFEGNATGEKSYYAIYPYSADVSISHPSGIPTISFVLPATQDYKGGNISDKTNPTVSYTTTGGDLKFKNLCGIINLQLKVAEGSKKISKITLESANSKLSGAAKVAMDYDLGSGAPSIVMAIDGTSSNRVSLDLGATGVELTTTVKSFYIVTPPLSISSDNSLTVIIAASNGAEIRKVTKGTQSVNRSRRLNMPELSCSFPTSTVNTSDISDISFSTATSGGNVTSDGGAAITARGVCWSTSKNPTVSDSKTSDGTGIGNYSSNISGLAQNTTYYIRAYATNSIGTSYGDEKTFKTNKVPTYSYIEGGVNYGNGIPISLGGNLGIKIFAPVNCGYEAATETPSYKGYPYGKLYQWGRRHGQGYASGDATIPTFSNGTVANSVGQDVSSKNIFYKVASSPYDWCSSPNDKLWNSNTETIPIKTDSDPCPNGWRVPTKSELDALRANKSDWTSYNSQNGYWFSGSVSYNQEMQNKSAVFFSASGFRDCDGGGVNYRGTDGGYWSSSPNGTNAWNIYFINGSAATGYANRANGYSVRCVRGISVSSDDDGYGDDDGVW